MPLYPLKINGEVIKHEQLAEVICPACGRVLDCGPDLEYITCCGKKYTFHTHTLRVTIEADQAYVPPQAAPNPEFAIIGCPACKRTFDASVHPLFCPFCGHRHVAPPAVAPQAPAPAPVEATPRLCTCGHTHPPAQAQQEVPCEICNLPRAECRCDED